MKLEAVIRAKAKENISLGGKNYSPKEGLLNSAKVPSPINTRNELAKAAGVSGDTMLI